MAKANEEIMEQLEENDEIFEEELKEMKKRHLKSNLIFGAKVAGATILVVGVGTLVIRNHALVAKVAELEEALAAAKAVVVPAEATAEVIDEVLDAGNTAVSVF